MALEEYPVRVLKKWYQSSTALFDEHCLAATFTDSGHGSAVVRLETPRYLIDISAWNNAACLDIEILDVDSEQSVFPTVGDCASQAVFEEHIATFNTWLCQTRRKNNPCNNGMKGQIA